MRKFAATLVAVAALSMVPVQAALADAPSDGCPRGYDLWDVTTEPYQADNQSDENGDGWVCARAMGNQTFTDENGDEHQIYLFRDNDLPASDN